MGAASYNRGNRAIYRDTDRRIAECRAAFDDRACLWRDLLAEGHILTFEGSGGAVVTAGANASAVPGAAPPFAVYRDHGDSRWRGVTTGSAWACALAIVDHVGRRRPVKVTHPRE